MYKKILTGVFVVLIFFAITNNIEITHADESRKSGDWEYSILDDGTVMLEKYLGKATSINVPSEIEGKQVAVIGFNLFYDNAKIVKIVLPGTITSIEEYAFAYCTNLTNITLPDSVSYIAFGAFAGCSSLKSIEIPNGISTINDSTFYECKSLTNVIIPESVNRIISFAFGDCNKLNSVVIPKGVEKIDADAFDGCNNLTIYSSKDSCAYKYAKAEGISWFELKKNSVPSQVATFKQDSTYSTTSITMSWKKITGATGYEVYRATSNKGAYSKVNATTGTSYKNGKLTSGKTYYYKVRAYKTINGTKIYGKFSSVKAMGTKPQTPIIELRSGKNKVKVVWKKIAGVSGYEEYMSASKAGKYTKIKTSGSKNTAYLKTGLTSGKKYYFKMRSYRTVAGKKIYSSWSAIKSITVK